MEYEPQKYLHKKLLYHHLYLGHTHTKTSQNIPNTPLALLTHPKFGHSQHCQSVQTTNAQVDSSHHVGSDPARPPRTPSKASCVHQLTETRPRISRCFRRSRKSSKPGMASRMKNDVIRCSKSRSVRNVIPWLYLNIAKIDVFLPFFTISGSWLLFREHI